MTANNDAQNNEKDKAIRDDAPDNFEKDTGNKEEQASEEPGQDEK